MISGRGGSAAAPRGRQSLPGCIVEEYSKHPSLWGWREGYNTCNLFILVDACSFGVYLVF